MAMATNTVIAAPHAAVMTPMRPSTAAAVSINVGAMPKGAVTGMAIASAVCSGFTSRTHSQMPRIA